MIVTAQTQIINQSTQPSGDPIHPDSYGTVVINITDPATGLPTNGNNVVVSYDKITNGVHSSFQTTIPGQSKVIYSGILKSIHSDIFISFVVTGVSETPDPGPPVNQCDLVLQSIQVTTPESSPGADDAAIKVNATSSYGDIEYSIDNINFQTSNIFTGLHGGLYTVYLRDTNPVGCAINGNVTIPVLTSLLQSDPGIVDGDNTSRWNAVFNPIVFKYQRKDYEITNVILSTIDSESAIFVINGDMTPLINQWLSNQAAIANAETQGIQLDDINLYIYVNAGSYQGVYIMTNYSGNDIMVNTPYVGDADGFMNCDFLRPYYKIITKVKYIDPETGQLTFINSYNRPNSTGLIKASLETFFQSVLTPNGDKSQYVDINYRDNLLSASYQISYAESWQDGTLNGHVSDYVDYAPVFYVVYAAKQLQEKGGGNLIEYVPFKNKAAKWISDFKEPVYSTGFPFDLSFIYGEDLAGLQLYYGITLLDINRNPISGVNEINSYLLNEDRSFLLNEDKSRFIIATQTLDNTPIVEHVGLNRLLINNDFGDEVYFFKIGIFYNNDDDNPVQVLADQIVKIDKSCDYNSVYLRWIGLSGSWNYYRFVYNQEVTLDVQNATIIKRFVEDWENGDTIEDVITKDASEKVQVHAVDMSVDDIKGCQSMKYSPKVQVCTAKGPVKWQTVVLNTATFAEYETELGAYEFAVTFNKPSKNIQSQ